MAPIEDWDREEFRAERNKLVQRANVIADSFDKNLAALASGSLVLLITFLKEVKVGATTWAIVAIIGFTLGLVCSILGILVSQKAHEAGISRIDLEWDLHVSMSRPRNEGRTERETQHSNENSPLGSLTQREDRLNDWTDRLTNAALASVALALVISMCGVLYSLEKNKQGTIIEMSKSGNDPASTSTNSTKSLGTKPSSRGGNSSSTGNSGSSSNGSSGGGQK